MLTRRDIRRSLGIILRAPSRDWRARARAMENHLSGEPSPTHSLVEAVLRATRRAPLHVEEASPYALLAAERRRQLARWTPTHDDDHRYGELAQAAAAYAWPVNSIRVGADATVVRATLWPFEPNTFKPAPAEAQVAGRLRDLTRAGALIVAEMERLQRERARISEAFDGGWRDERELEEFSEAARLRERELRLRELSERE